MAIPAYTDIETDLTALSGHIAAVLAGCADAGERTTASRAINFTVKRLMYARLGDVANYGLYRPGVGLAPITVQE